MIIFSNDCMLPLLKVSPEKFNLLNLFNPICLGTPLRGLFPPDSMLQIAPYDSMEFEAMYVNYIVSTDVARLDFMKIMMANYESEVALVLTDLGSPVIEPMVDCIAKVIQKRYGCLCNYVQELGDFEYAKDYPMTELGEQIFLQDKEWYVHSTVNPTALLSGTQRFE